MSGDLEPGREQTMPPYVARPLPSDRQPSDWAPLPPWSSEGRSLEPAAPLRKPETPAPPASPADEPWVFAEPEPGPTAEEAQPAGTEDPWAILEPEPADTAPASADEPWAFVDREAAGSSGEAPPASAPDPWAFLDLDEDAAAATAEESPAADEAWALLDMEPVSPEEISAVTEPEAGPPMVEPAAFSETEPGITGWENELELDLDEQFIEAQAQDVSAATPPAEPEAEALEEEFWTDETPGIEAEATWAFEPAPQPEATEPPVAADPETVDAWDALDEDEAEMEALWSLDLPKAKPEGAPAAATDELRDEGPDLPMDEAPEAAEDRPPHAGMTWATPASEPETAPLDTFPGEAEAWGAVASAGPSESPTDMDPRYAELAARLESFAASLRRDGPDAVRRGFAGDRLTAALAGLITAFEQAGLDA